MVAAMMTTAAPEDRMGRTRGRPYKREFVCPEDKAQENFTDPTVAS